jgi:hypothetical protein
MNTVRTIMKLTAVGVAAFLLIGVIIVGNPKAHLRPCGHPEDFLSRVGTLTGLHLENHDCAVVSMYNDIRAIAAAQDGFHTKHGNYATTLDVVTNFLGSPLTYKIQLKSSEQFWYATVPAQDRFPGNYLFRGGPMILRVYFSTNGPASTNDLVLCDL